MHHLARRMNHTGLIHVRVVCRNKGGEETDEAHMLIVTYFLYDSSLDQILSGSDVFLPHEEPGV